MCIETSKGKVFMNVAMRYNQHREEHATAAHS
jgi:hypothetical protein